MKQLAFLLTAAFFLASLTAPVAGSDVFHGTETVPSKALASKLDDQLFDYQVLSLDTKAIAQHVATASKLDVVLGSERFVLELEPDTVVTEDFAVTYTTPNGDRVERPKFGTFKGRIAGDPTSEVRLLIEPGLFEGYIRSEAFWYFVDPIAVFDKTNRSSDLVFYRDDDVRPESRGMCGSGALHEIGKDHVENPTAAPPSLKGGEPRRVLQMALEADFQYWNIHRNNTASRIIGRISQVSGIYLSEYNIFIRVVNSHIWTTASPFTTGNINVLLQQVRGHFNAAHGGLQRDIGHLFTGINLSGFDANGNFTTAIVGVAYVSTICRNPGLAYSISENNNNAVKIIAHEVGHAFSACHSDTFACSGAYVQRCGGTGPLMCSNIQAAGPNTFSFITDSHIRNHLNNWDGCLAQPPVASCTTSITGPFVNFNASNSFDPNGTIVSYRWDFGDGIVTTTTTPTVGHLYNGSGFFLARLTVTDNEGESSTVTKFISLGCGGQIFC